MTKEELEKVFNFLEKEMNKQGLFYFKLTDTNEITAYWIHDCKSFARFDISKISEIVGYEVKDEQEWLWRNN